MADALVPLRRRRNMCGYNVFTQEHGGKKFKVGSAGQKSRHVSICAAWGKLAPEERGNYEVKAAAQQADRDKLSDTTLADTTASDFQLTPAQMQRLGQRRLSKSLKAQAEHAVWSKGLALMSQCAGLRPELVPDDINMDDALASLKEVLSYDPVPYPNPKEMPKYFQPCHVLHPGLCAADPGAGDIFRMATQLQLHLERCKTKPCILLRLQRVRPSSASSSSAAVAASPELWFILGSFSLRPLCHILVGFDRYLPFRTALKLQEKDSMAVIQTGYEVIKSYWQDAGPNTQELEIAVSVMEYHAVSKPGLENHIVFNQVPSHDFAVGPRLVHHADKKESQCAFKLPFGLKLAQNKSKHTASGKGKVVLGHEEAKPEEEEGDDTDCYLSPEEQAELRMANKISDGAAKDDEEDVPKDEGEDPGRAQRTRATPLKNARPGPQGPTLGPGMRLGLSAFCVTTRNSKCALCDQTVYKNDQRFEYYFSLSKAPRSIHTYCATIMPTSARGPSKEWLAEEVKSHSLGSEGHSLLSKLLHNLNDLDSAE